MTSVPPGLASRIRELFPGAELSHAEALGPDAGHGQNEKVAGYGVPLKLTVRADDGSQRCLVFRTATPNDFGHDRRSDRAQAMLLDYDTFSRIPEHVRALDVGAVDRKGRLVSLASAGEFYVLTTYAEGTVYAEDLRRILATGESTRDDLDRCEMLARYLVHLHNERVAGASSYRRAVRDLLGSGEGIFGIVDGYPDDTPGAPPALLRRLEELCLDWRWRLRSREHRLTRTHGDFHPFNVVFAQGGRVSLLDASRGCEGEPADDVTAMAVNYLFFCIDQRSAWRRAFRPLWRAFWQQYIQGRGDEELLAAAPPFLAWRALVVCNPRFYPGLSESGRAALLSFVAKTLEAGAVSLDAADELFP